MLINKRSREDAENTRLNLKGKLTAKMDITGRVAKFVDCRSKDVSEREIFIVEGDSALGACQAGARPELSGCDADPRQNSELPESGLRQDFQK